MPYGYVKGQNKRVILIDEDAVEIVQYIFHLAANEHLSTSAIALRLNSEGVKSPSLYRYEKWGYKGKVQPLWMVSTVYRILTNRIYTGSFEMYKRHVIAVGSSRMAVIPRENRVIIHNTHEAIVSEAVYCEAQKVVIAHKKHLQPKHEKRRPKPTLAKYLKCGCCGVRLVRPICTEPIFTCRTATIQKDSPCERVSCDATALEPLVYQAIYHLTELAEVEQQKRLRRQEQLQQGIRSLKQQIRTLSQRRQEIVEEKLVLYELLQAGTLDQTAFQARKREADQRLKAIQTETEVLTLQLLVMKKELDSIEEEPTATSPAIDTNGCLTPELLEAFVSKVVIREGGEPEIVFQLQDLFQRDLPS